MEKNDLSRARPRTFNTPFESGIRSVIILTACYPSRLALDRLVVLDHLVVHSGDFDGPSSLHPAEDSRVAEILVRRRLVDSGLALMGTRNLVKRSATNEGFRFEAGEEAGAFVDLLRTWYLVELKVRAQWLSAQIMPLSDDGISQLVRDRIDDWSTDFVSNAQSNG